MEEKNTAYSGESGMLRMSMPTEMPQEANTEAALRSEIQQLRTELEILRSLRETDGKRIEMYITTIRALTELSAHGWLNNIPR